MSFVLFLVTFAKAETPAEESARLLVERGVYATRLTEIDRRLVELGVTVPAVQAVPEKPAYKPSFKAIKVEPAFKGSEKVAERLRAHQDEFATCWAIEEHATGVSTWIGEDGRVEYNPQTLMWLGTKGMGAPETAKIKACYAGVLETIWDFPSQPKPIKKSGTTEDTFFDPEYNIEFLYG